MLDEEDARSFRRQVETVACEFEGTRFFLTLGFYGERVGEVYAEGIKHGSTLDLLVQDACSLITALLQRYISPPTLMEWLHRKPDGSPASLIGAITLEITETVARTEGDANA